MNIQATPPPRILRSAATPPRAPVLPVARAAAEATMAQQGSDGRAISARRWARGRHDGPPLGTLCGAGLGYTCTSSGDCPEEIVADAGQRPLGEALLGAAPGAGSSVGSRAPPRQSPQPPPQHPLQPPRTPPALPPGPSSPTASETARSVRSTPLGRAWDHPLSLQEQRERVVLVCTREAELAAAAHEEQESLLQGSLLLQSCDSPLRRAEPGCELSPFRAAPACQDAAGVQPGEEWALWREAAVLRDENRWLHERVQEPISPASLSVSLSASPSYVYRALVFAELVFAACHLLICALAAPPRLAVTYPRKGRASFRIWGAVFQLAVPSVCSPCQCPVSCFQNSVTKIHA